LTRTILVCLLVSFSYQKEIQKNATDSLQGSYPNVDQEEYLLRSRRSTHLPRRITFKIEMAITKRLLNEFNGGKRQAEKWVLSKVTDANKRYKHHTLDTQVTIEVVNERDIKIVEEDMHYRKQIKQYKDQYLGEKYPLGIFGLDEGESDFQGRASVGAACPQDCRQWKYCGLGAFMIRDDPKDISGGLLAHEIGHLIGMSHNIKRGCGEPDGGVMNRGVDSYATHWTSCNNKDLKKYYQDLGRDACM